MRIDLKKDRKALYQPGAGDFSEAIVPETGYLAIDGRGDPNTAPQYADAVAALFTTAYAVRSVVKREAGLEFVAGPLEGLWWHPDPEVFASRDKKRWYWTMLIPLPDRVGEQAVASGLAVAARKKPGLPVDRVRRLVLNEGRVLQIMHIGSYDDEAPTLARLHDEVMPARGLTFNGHHHEIYLGDPRRVTAARLRTVLRQPVKPIG